MNYNSSPFLYKLNYLRKYNANNQVFFSFIKFQITKIFYNHFRSKEKYKYKTLIKKKLITHDFFSLYSFDWKKILKYYKFKKINYLEIGSFEGISAYFIYKYLNPKLINCVDTWKGSKEHGKDTIFKKVEHNFNYNLRGIKSLKKCKTTSDIFFKKNIETFDIIYIDGYHKYFQVKKDLLNALRVLKDNGIIICDDYFWNISGNKKDIPISAINEVVKKFNLKVKYVNVNQIFLTK